MSEQLDIKAARRKLGWSARVLAEHSGVSMRTIQRMELGHCTPLPLLRRAVEQALEHGEYKTKIQAWLSTEDDEARLV